MIVQKSEAEGESLAESKIVLPTQEEWDKTRARWLALYDLGFNGVPLHPRTKEANRKWRGYSRFKDERLQIQSAVRQNRTTLIDWLYNYFKQPGSCDFFLLTGWTPEAKIVVIDSDDDLAMEVVDERCDDTPMRAKSRRGEHRYYKHPGEDIWVKTKAKVTLHGEMYNIDIKGDGGGVVAPGSIHKTGFVYEWAEPWTPEMIANLPVFDPSWLPDEGNKKNTIGGFDFDLEDIKEYDDLLEIDDIPPLASRIERARQYLKKCPGTTEGDGASDRCMWLCSKIAVGFLIPYDEALEIISDEWAGKDDQLDSGGGHFPWTDSQIAHKVGSAISGWRNYPGKPGDMVRDEKISLATAEAALNDLFKATAEDWLDALVNAQGGDCASVQVTYQPPEAEPPKSRYLLDLEKVGIQVLDQKSHNGSVIYPVECPCCGLIGTFSWNVANFKSGYECGAGRRTWAEGKALWATVTENGARKRRGFLVDELDAIPTPTWIVKDHLLTDSLAILYGPSNVGKTFLGLDLGLSVATGIKFAGSFNVTQGVVAYVIGEGVGGIKKRIKAWKKAHGHAGPIDGFVIIPYQFALAAVDPGEAREIVEIAAGRLGRKPSLVIIDTLARNFGAGANENDTAVMSAFVKSCDLIKEECGGSVAVIHHTGKDQSKGMRGAYSLVGGADTIIYCGEHGHRMGMQIECEKQKDVDFFPPYVMLKEVVDLGGDGTSLAFVYRDLVLKTSKGDTPIAQWKNDAEIVYHFSPETVETAKGKGHIVADVRAGMLSRQMTPLGENKVRTLIDTLVLNGRLAATGGEKNEKHTKYYKNSTPSAGFVSDFFEGGDEPVEG